MINFFNTFHDATQNLRAEPIETIPPIVALRCALSTLHKNANQHDLSQDLKNQITSLSKDDTLEIVSYIKENLIQTNKLQLPLKTQLIKTLTTSQHYRSDNTVQEEVNAMLESQNAPLKLKPEFSALCSSFQVTQEDLRMMNPESLKMTTAFLIFMSEKGARCTTTITNGQEEIHLTAPDLEYKQWLRSQYNSKSIQGKTWQQLYDAAADQQANSELARFHMICTDAQTQTSLFLGCKRSLGCPFNPYAGDTEDQNLAVSILNGAQIKKIISFAHTFPNRIADQDFQFEARIFPDEGSSLSAQLSCIQEIEHGVRTIEQSLKAGHNALVCCSQGASRSATIAIAYLMKAQKLSFEAALEMAFLKRNVVKPKFIAILKFYEQYLAEATNSGVTHTNRGAAEAGGGAAAAQ